MYLFFKFLIVYGDEISNDLHRQNTAQRTCWLSLVSPKTRSDPAISVLILERKKNTGLKTRRGKQHYALSR